MELSTRTVERRLAKPATDAREDLLRARFHRLRQYVGPVIRGVRVGENISRQELSFRLLDIVPQVWGCPDELLIEDVEIGKHKLTFVEFGTVCKALQRSREAILDAAELEKQK